MYPRLSDLFSDLFGIPFPLDLYSFGAMVAAAAILAGWLTSLELNRMYGAGLIPGIRVPAKDDDSASKKRGRRKRGSQTHVASPSEMVWTLTIYAVGIGLLGAKVFHALENWDTFVQDPARMLFASGGLTFYGGLIAAALFVAWYVRRKGIPVARFADAVAPGLLLAYGVGRIGCHLAGDGDWGIASALSNKPAWIPTWLWAETYPRNILGVDLSQQPVYPTPLYEFLMCAALFAVLWGLRKHPFLAGWLFGVYLMMAAVERFLIEQIRVNNTFDVFGLSITQAEFISALLFLTGAVLVAFTSRRSVPDTSQAVPDANLATHEAP